MRGIYRATFAFLIPLGLMAVFYVLVDFFEWDVPTFSESPAATPELVVALVVGLWLPVFSLTALRHARLELDAGELRHLRFGPICGMGVVPLARIRRFGVGVEHSRQGRDHILLLDLTDDERRTIKLTMYADWPAFVDRLGARLGQQPAETERTWKGARFVD